MARAPLWPRPFGWLRQRWQQWWLTRQPPTDQLQLTQRNVFILPTRAGAMLALTLLVLLVTAINFQLNLGYLLTFMLTGSASVAMLLGHNNLRGLHLHLLAPEPQYLGDAVHFDIELSSADRRARYGLALAVQGSGHWAWADVAAGGHTRLRSAFQPSRRGLQALPTLTAQTHYPLGIFRVWSHWRPAAQVLVLPRPEAHPPPLPAVSSGALDIPTSVQQHRGQGEFDGVRAYQRGDARKLVLWRQTARAIARGSDELVSRDRQQAQHHSLWLDYAQTGSAAGLEARLSRLCAWVLQADRLGLEYGLRLPGAAPIAPSQGAAHRRRCLEALALC